MFTELSRLSAPMEICGRRIRNRIVVPPMANFGLSKKDGFVGNGHQEYYGAYAEGGAGLIIVEASSVVPPRNTLELYDDNCIPGMTRLADTIISKGAVALVQLLHGGLGIIPETEISQITRTQFFAYKEAFISAAIRCKKAGFYGVELHAAHGFYLNQIVETSERTDEYGGDFENRVRILVELIEKIKETCGEDFIVAVRFGNPNYEELLKTANVIEQAGGDLLDISTGLGVYTNISVGFPFDSKIYAASLVKQKAHIPVICVGNITFGKQAEQILENGYADMVAVGRGHLCDPEWSNKVFAGEIPVLCRNCHSCQWYVDVEKCPGVIERNRK